MRTRGIILVIIVLLIIAAVFAWKLFNPGPTAFAGGSTVSLADYHAADPTGVPADLAIADIVKRGEYLARAADCMVCHTAPDGAEYAGGLAFPTPFGTLYSLTSHPQGNRHRQLHRSGYSKRRAARGAPDGARTLSGDTIPVLYLYDRP